MTDDSKNRNRKMKKQNAFIITIDVEDWFQVENFKSYIPYSSWSSFDLRVERNTHKILDLLDDFAFSPRVTFFVLGWIARRTPRLLREILKRGHEVASHGVDHHLPLNQSSKDFSEDLQSSRKLLEDITGERVYGYRAPSFSINNDVLDLIQEAGYLYDSSYNSFAMHDRYGALDLSNALKQGAFYKVSNDFYELPVSNLGIGRRILPWGGGGYFRLIPLVLYKQGVRSVLKKENAFIFYSHPWEFDPDQPRVEQASAAFKFRHYIHLKKTETKLRKMIESFQDCNFTTCVDSLGRG